MNADQLALGLLACSEEDIVQAILALDTDGSRTQLMRAKLTSLERLLSTRSVRGLVI